MKLTGINNNAIAPDQIIETKIEVIPDKFISIVNTLIALNWDGNASRVLKEDILMLGVENGLNFPDNCYNFEVIYVNSGWNVFKDVNGGYYHFTLLT